MKNIIVGFFILVHFSSFSQKVSNVFVVYDNTYDQVSSTIETHLEENKLNKVLKKVKSQGLYIKSKNDITNVVTDSKGKQYSFEGKKDYYCNSCEQIASILSSNKSNDIETALYILDPPASFNLDDCALKSRPTTSVNYKVRNTSDLYKEVYSVVKKKAKASKKNYSIVFWSPGKSLKGLNFTLNNKSDDEITANFNEKVVLRLNDANTSETYKLSINGEIDNGSINNSNKIYSKEIQVKKTTEVCLSNGACPAVCKTIVVENACTSCNKDVELDLDFLDNKYAKTDKLIRQTGLDYEILQGKQGYKLFYFVVKNQPCVEKYELQMTLKFMGEENEPENASAVALAKKHKSTPIKFDLEVSVEETNDPNFIILKANYNDLYNDGSGVVDDEMQCTIQIVPIKCSGNMTGSPGKKYKVTFQKCN